MRHAARQLPSWLIFDVGQKKMKRIAVVWVIAAVAAVLLVLLLLLPREKSPIEIVRLSEALVIVKVQAYHQHPSPTTLAAVKDAIANHRKAIERAQLPAKARETMEQSLYEQIFIVRGIAHNDDLKL
jgi:hypothetical protein